MKKSRFIVEQIGSTDDTKLLYSTFSTSLVEIDNEIYNAIFVEKKYDKYEAETIALKNMGFLIDDAVDELEQLKQLRIKTIEANKNEPSYYIICPTTGCNARCYYCFESGAVQKRMDDITVEAVLNYILENHDSENLVLQWFGGEPLLEPNTISYICNGLKQNKVKFDSKIITNGLLLTDDIIQKAINEWNVKIIQITIDDLGERYNKIKNYVYSDIDAFEIVMNNIECCLKYKLNIRIRINFNPLESEKAIRTANYLWERFGDFDTFFVYFAPIDSSDSKIPSITNQFENSKKHPLIQLLDAQEHCSFGNYNTKENSGINKVENILKKYYLYPIPTSCYGGCESSLTIDSCGNIFSCHRYLGREEYASGNVFNGRCDNEFSLNFSNPNITDEACNNCNLLPICQGGCKYRAFQFGKNHSCTMIKGAVEELIKRAEREISML